MRDDDVAVVTEPPMLFGPWCLNLVRIPLKLFGL